MMSEEQVLELFVRCSNQGRWGADDELGTLNYITPEVRRAALESVVDGIAVSIAFDLAPQRGATSSHHMLFGGVDAIGSEDAIHLVTHGFENTHMDAVGHTFFGGRLYNGRSVRDHVLSTGLAFVDIAAMRDGIITRGVILDVARSRGREFLDIGDLVTASDLDRAAELAGVTLRAGDAILVRTGRGARIAATGPERNDVREGVAADVVPWLHEHAVAVYGGDCIERLPSGYPQVPLPLHQVGHTAMGLAILDIVDMEALRRATDRFGRGAFLLMIAPLRIPGGTGSLVNPLAVF